MMNIHRQLLANGVNSYVVWGRGRKSENDYEISIEDNLDILFHGVYTRITDKTGFASKKSTKKLISILEKIKPDIVQLHNIHGYYLNIELLFDYIREKEIKVIWTLHDCWVFTGHCAYFDMVGCEKWKTGCYDCEQLATYPAALFADASDWNWRKKKALFTGLNITLITPSYWLKTLVEQSFLGEYPVKVIHNGIDTNLFKPSESIFRKKYGFEDNFIILGVASEWTERKGLNDFVRLEEMLNGNLQGKCKIVLVGLTKKQIAAMPASIIALERTSNVQELVGIYTTADVFFNPTYEDNFPTTNLEAIACGTPVVTYGTGGSPESLNEECGMVLGKGQVELFARLITDKCSKKMGYKIKKEHNIKMFDQENMINQYIQFYNIV